MKVGIPRALLYHHYGSCWLDFLERLGVEGLVSEPTTDDVITTGSVRADNETCLPVKVFSGHLMSLKDEVDAILVPRVVSPGAGSCACPKFLGLPDLARALDEEMPPVIAPRIEVGRRKAAWAPEWYRAGRALGAPRAVSAAAAVRLVRDLERLDRCPERAEPSGELTIGVAGHLYNVHDERASQGLLDRIRALGARPVTVDEVDPRQARRQAESLSRQLFWGFERAMAGAVLHWSRTRAVTGILFVTSFACGPGSIVGALLEDELVRESGVPLMSLILDEHTAEAGIVTRLEAFVDMLSRSASARPQALGEGAAG